MANLKSVQKGVFTLAANKEFDTLTLSDLVDPTKTILFKGGVRIDNEGEWPSYANILVSLTDSSTITFERIEANGVKATISWYVVEFESGVRVQHAIEEFDREDTRTVEITDIDLSKSFCLISYKTNGHRFGDDDFCRARVLEESGQKKIEMSFGTSTRGAVSWQVVEIKNDSEVQNGLVNLAGNKASINKTISNFDLTKSFLIFSYRVSGEAKPNALAIRGFLSDPPNKLTFERSSSSSGISADISWFVVHMTDGTSVQQMDIPFGDGDKTGNTTIDPVTIKNTSVHISSLQQFGKNELSSADEFGKAMVTVDLDKTDKVLHERGQANSAAGIWTFYVIQWAKETENNGNGGDKMSGNCFNRGVKEPQKMRKLIKAVAEGIEDEEVRGPLDEYLYIGNIAGVALGGPHTTENPNPRRVGTHLLFDILVPDVGGEKNASFIAAQVSKLHGSDNIVVVLMIDGRLVMDMSYAKARLLGLGQKNNPFGVVFHDGEVQTLTIGFPTPLFFQSQLQLYVRVLGPGVAKIEANVVYGVDSAGGGDASPPPNGHDPFP